MTSISSLDKYSYKFLSQTAVNSLAMNNTYSSSMMTAKIKRKSMKQPAKHYLFKTVHFKQNKNPLQDNEIQKNCSHFCKFGLQVEKQDKNSTEKDVYYYKVSILT